MVLSAGVRVVLHTPRNLHPLTRTVNGDGTSPRQRYQFTLRMARLAQNSRAAWYNRRLMAIFTGRVERAIALALRAHEAQVRKGDGQLPYVVHPVTVA